jgi:hypothetical protein
MARLCNECNENPVGDGKFSKLCPECVMKSFIVGAAKTKINCQVSSIWRGMGYE